MSSPAPLSLTPYLARVRQAEPAPLIGQVVRVVGLVVESVGPPARVGDVCELRNDQGRRLPMEVVGFRDGRLLSVPLGDTAGIRPGDRVVVRSGASLMPVGDAVLGRVIDGMGQPIDGKGPIAFGGAAPLKPAALNPLAREPITTPISTGVRAIDAMLTCGTRPAHRVVRRQRRGQEHAAGHDGPRHRSRRGRPRAGRRARPRGPQLSRTGPRPGGARAVRGRRVDLRQPASRPAARRVRRHHDRGALPRRAGRTCCS